MEQTKHRKEEREAAHELLEEWEKHMKSQKSRDGKEARRDRPVGEITESAT